AFSSDSIPIHLLNREALKLYLSHLDKGGVIALHISNRYLNLRPVVRRLAADAGLPIRMCDDQDYGLDKSGSNWVVLARSDADFGPLHDLFSLPHLRDDDYDDLIPQGKSRLALGLIAGGILPLRARERWPLMEVEPDDPLWTDDFSNLLKIVNWNWR